MECRSASLFLIRAEATDVSASTHEATDVSASTDVSVGTKGRKEHFTGRKGAPLPSSSSFLLSPPLPLSLPDHLADQRTSAKKQGVYLAVDGLTAAHLDAIRLLFPYATAFELYPWLNQGFRRVSHRNWNRNSHGRPRSTPRSA